MKHNRQMNQMTASSYNSISAHTTVIAIKQLVQDVSFELSSQTLESSVNRVIQVVKKGTKKLKKWLKKSA